MQWNNKFSYPKSMRSMVNGSRMYAVNQEKLPSVTSILQATQSEEKKASLANWKARVETVEGDLVVIPNSKIAGNSVLNFSQGLASTRIKVSVGVAYGSDVELVRQLLLDAITAQPQIVKSPSPQVVFCIRTKIAR